MRIAGNEAMRLLDNWNKGHLTLHDAILQRLDEIERRLKTLEAHTDGALKELEAHNDRILTLKG
jgi:flagellar motility protein MotE (MotC chaperone)